MSPELILYLLSWAVFYTGYPMPDEPPTIIYVPHSYFVIKMCNNYESAAEPCRVRAMYSDYDTGILWLDRAYNVENPTAGIKSIVVHEMVHYLQDLSGDYKGMDNWPQGRQCVARVRRQIEAYIVQDKYMLDVHAVRRDWPRPRSICGEF